VRLLLNIHPKAELAITTFVALVDTRVLASEINSNVTHANATLANIYRDMLKREEGTDNQNLTVSDNPALDVAKQTLTTA